MRGEWWPLAAGAVTGLAVSTVQRMYPDISFVALLGLSVAGGAMFNLALFVVSKKLKAK
jgi:hypothetical protein